MNESKLVCVSTAPPPEPQWLMSVVRVKELKRPITSLSQKHTLMALIKDQAEWLPTVSEGELTDSSKQDSEFTVRIYLK